jgi:hypothetical protein
MLLSETERLGQFVNREFICVPLRRVRSGVTHEGLKRDEILSALPQEAICEAVTQRVR